MPYDPSLDLTPYPSDTPAIAYVICSTPRSGSSFLGRLMAQTGRLGQPAEYFNPYSHFHDFAHAHGVRRPEQLLPPLIRTRTSPNGCFGFKAHAHQFQFLVDHAGKLDDHLPHLHYIFLERQDRVAQAVSYVRAQQTKAWNSNQAEQAEPRLDLAWLHNRLTDIERMNLYWRWLLAKLDISFLHLTYEGLAADPEGTLAAVAAHLGVAAPGPIDWDLVGRQPQRDELNAIWHAEATKNWRDELRLPLPPGTA